MKILLPLYVLKSVARKNRFKFLIFKIFWDIRTLHYIKITIPTLYILRLQCLHITSSNCRNMIYFANMDTTNNIVYKSCLRKLHYLLCNSITGKIILVSNSLLVANLLRYLDPAE
jgi:hypothetical protein